MSELTDRFSWRRVWMVAYYMLPTLKKQLIMYPIVVLAVTLGSDLLYEIGWMQLTDAGIFGMLSGFMFYFAPAALARRDNRVLVAQLPAKTSEKFAFLLIYFWIVIAAITIGLNMAICELISIFLPGMSMASDEILKDSLGMIGPNLTYVKFIGMLCALALQAFSLYGVVHARTNRVIAAIGYSFAAYAGMCVLSGIIGMIVAIFNFWGLRASYEEPGNDMSPDDFASELVVTSLPSIMTIVTVLLSIVAAIMLVRTYKIIRHRGF